MPPVTLWARNADTVEEINTRHTNEKYLPGAKLHDRLVATHSVDDCVANSDVIVMGIPSHNFRSVLEEVRDQVRPWVPIVSLTKGLEAQTGKRMSQIVNDVLPGHPVGVLTGAESGPRDHVGFLLPPV